MSNKEPSQRESIHYDTDTTTYGVYTIFDTTSGEYGPIFTARNHAVAQRYFRQSIKDVELYGADFELRMVGYFRQPPSHPDRTAPQDKRVPIETLGEYVTITVPPVSQRSKYNIPDQE
jgi:hypothetical protein